MMIAVNQKEEAKKIVARFISRFGKSYELLVYHAAIPLILTPELLNYLRHQFLRGQVPWVAEVDLLLSDLFNPVGYELYAMDTAVRAYLLENIKEFFQKQRFDQQHLQEVALILLGYIKYLARTNSFLRAPELQAQQWAAMVCLEDKQEQVVREIKEAFQKCDSETELARLTQITQQLSPQLSNYPSLIQFAESVRDLLRDSDSVKPGLTHPDSLSAANIETITQLSQALEIDLSKFPKLGIRGRQSIGLKKILLVEDRPEVIQQISELLSSPYGITVRGTDNVKEVIKQVESGEIDLILINYELPNSRHPKKGNKVNGIKIVHLLRKELKIAKFTPIIGFSILVNRKKEFLRYADGFYDRSKAVEEEAEQDFINYLRKIYNRVKLLELLPYESAVDLDSVLDLIGERHLESKDTSEEDVSRLWNKPKGDDGTFYLLENLRLLDVLVMTASGKETGTVRYDLSPSYLNQNSPRLYPPPDGDEFDQRLQQLPSGQRDHLLKEIKQRSQSKQDTSLADVAHLFFTHPQGGDIATYRRLENLRLFGFLSITDLGTNKETIRYNLSLKYQKYLAYTQLRSLLEAKQWQKADRKTAELMYLIANRVEEEWLRQEDIEQFPCDDLLSIDQLWIKASNGQFGFTVQQSIYKESGGTKEYQQDIWRAFGDRLGWRVEGKWLSYRELNFAISAPTGHLPMGAATSQKQLLGAKRLLFSRLEICQLENLERGLALRAFEFETVTVNNRGQELERETHSARYFTEDLGNAITLDMVYIPGGNFQMGTEDEEIERLVKKFDRQWFREESPQHEVTVPPFFMGKYPVTQAQWKAIALRTDLQVNKDIELPLEPSNFDKNPQSFSFPSTRSQLDLPAYGNNPSRWHRPVEQVNWYQAKEFCDRLSQLTGREYRLPTEAEWEYACRAIQNSPSKVQKEESIQNPIYPPFHFGETITTDLANYNGNYTYADEPKGVYRGETTPVGMFPPNAFGLYDLHGNVWEWCGDTWHDNYENAPTDGSAWITEGDKTAVLRGGSWFTYPNNCRSAFRIIIRARTTSSIGVFVWCHVSGELLNPFRFSPLSLYPKKRISP